MRFWLVVFLAAAALAQGARFVNPGGRFAVTVAGKLEETTNANETPLGTVEEHIFRWRAPGLEWVVNYSDVPSVTTAVDGLLFLEVRHGFRRTTGFPVTNERDEPFLGHPARRFEFRIRKTKTRPQRSGVARVLVVDGRLYVLTVTWDKPELPADRSPEESFFGSFELLKPVGG